MSTRSSRATRPKEQNVFALCVEQELKVLQATLVSLTAAAVVAGALVTSRRVCNPRPVAKH